MKNVHEHDPRKFLHFDLFSRDLHQALVKRHFPAAWRANGVEMEGLSDDPVGQIYNAFVRDSLGRELQSWEALGFDPAPLGFYPVTLSDYEHIV